MTKLCPYARLGILLLVNPKRDLPWQTQQHSTPGKPLQPFPLPCSTPGRHGRTAGSERHICREPQALPDCSPSFEHLNIPSGPCQLLLLQRWQEPWPKPTHPRAHLVRAMGSRAEHSLGTPDRQSSLMADEHTRDPQPAYPPNSKF